MSIFSKNKFGDNGVISERFVLREKLGSGLFGVVFAAYDKEEKQEVAIKIDICPMKNCALDTEIKLYKILNGFTNIPKMKYYGVDGSPFMVMDLLGPSLENRFKLCANKFSLKTVLMLGIQFISCLENIHSKGVVHRDLKANNFVMGTGATQHKVFLLDFGIARMNREDQSRGDGHNFFISGSIFDRFRRMDLKSAGRILLYFLKGVELYTVDGDFRPDVPEEFGMYMRYCEGLVQYKTPDYQYLSNLFTGLLKKCGFEYDFQYDWS